MGKSVVLCSVPMARNRTAIRRVLFAGAASLCTFLAALAVVGVANAGTGTGDLPDSFRIAERHGGDKGQWLVTSTTPPGGMTLSACTGLNCGGSNSGMSSEEG